MPHSLSLYLDVVRFLAAFAVLLAHLSSRPFTEGLNWRGTAAFGDLAVTVFFVLSGYVISYVTTQRERRPLLYVAARVSRLYSVVAVALLLTLALDLAGTHLNEAFYSIQKVLWKPPSIEGYLASLFFVNEFQVFGFKGISPGTNGPYWSLSFEAAYYLIAGLFLFLRPKFWIPLAILVLLLGGRTISALLPLWLLGFYLHRLPHSRFPRLTTAFWLALFLSSATAVASAPTVAHLLPSDNFGYYFPWGRGSFNRNLIADYVAGSLFGVHLVAARELFERSKFQLPAAQAIRLLGSLTFPLYLFHYPIICFLCAISPWASTSKTHALFVTTGVMLTVVALTPFCDRIRDHMRTQIISRFSRPNEA